MKLEKAIKTIENAIEVCKRRAKALSKELGEVKETILFLSEELKSLREENEKLKKENAELKKMLKSIGITNYRPKSCIKDKVVKEGIRFLFAKYLELWRNQPPEKHKSLSWNGLLGRTFRQLIIIYEGDYKKLWEDYKEFFEIYIKCKEKWSRSRDCRYFYDGSITNFQKKLSEWKQRERKEVELSSKNKWLEAL